MGTVILLLSLLSFADPIEVPPEWAAARMRVSAGIPPYPPLARQARVAGVVKVVVMVGADGKVTEVRLVSGHPLLTQTVTSTLLQYEFEPMQSRFPFQFPYSVTFELTEPSAPARRIPPRPRPECRWRDEDVDRALACLEWQSQKTTEEYLRLSELLDFVGRDQEAFTALEKALPSSRERYLERAAMLGRVEEARRRAQ